MAVIGSLVLYAGIVTAFIALLATIRPIRKLGLTSRPRSAALLGVGVAIVELGLALPAPERRVARPVTHLDDFAPAYQFNEVHATRVAAPPERVYRALREVTAGEIPLFQLLTRIRRFGRSGPESILNAPDEAPILDVATRTGFMVLAADAPREFLVGTVVVAPDGWMRSATPTPEAFKAIRGAGFATATMNFLVTGDATGGSTLSTETRVYATDAPARRRFAVYWRVIYPGSALIRRGWLHAIRVRAERREPRVGSRELADD